MGVIFGTRAQPRVMTFKFFDDFRKMDPCKPPSCMGAWVGGLHGCMGPFSENGSMQDGGLHGSPQLGLLCGAALPGAFFQEKTGP